MAPGTTDALRARDLGELTGPEPAGLRALRVAPDQEAFGGTFDESVEAWRAAPADRMLGLAFVHAGAPVGTVLLRRPPLSPPWTPPDGVSLHGLMIAAPWQGRGWGGRRSRCRSSGPERGGRRLRC